VKVCNTERGGFPRIVKGLVFGDLTYKKHLAYKKQNKIASGLTYN
jgi:hypothetical protein